MRAGSRGVRGAGAECECALAMDQPNARAEFARLKHFRASSLPPVPRPSAITTAMFLPMRLINDPWVSGAASRGVLKLVRSIARSL